MAYAYRRGTVVWIGYTDSAGIKRQEPTKCRTKTEGRNLAFELERKAYRVGKGLEPELGEDTLFGERALEWLSKRPKEYRSRSTAETYLRQRIIPFLGEKSCRAMTREDVGEMLLQNEKPRQALDSKGRPVLLKAASAGTREKLRSYVHAIFEWLIDDLEVVGGQNPAGGKKMRVKVPKKIPRHIPVSELVELVRNISEYHRLLFVFAVVSGARKGELIPLTWEDIDLESRRVYISKSGEADTPKSGRDRVVIIPRWLVDAFRAQKEKRWSRYVFPKEDGKRRRFDAKLSRMLRGAAGRAGLVTGYRHTCRRKGCGWTEALADGVPVPCPKCAFTSWVSPIPRRYTFKDLRSTFGTLATAESGDIRFVQRVLGHGSVGTTEGHYVHALTGDLEAKTDALESFAGLAKVVSNL